jgi:hypothetical protein
MTHQALITAGYLLVIGRHNIVARLRVWENGDRPPTEYIGVFGPDRAANWFTLGQFIAITKLPRPLVVSSGSGLHVYWVLPEPLAPDVWRRYSSGLKNLCVKHGLLVDHSRTTDYSSILRTPGTRNYKTNSPKWVCINPQFLEQVACTFEDFTILLDHADKNVIPLHAGGGVINRKRAPSGLTAAALAGLHSYYQTSYAAQIVDHCGQLAQFRDKKGVVDEPLWYATLGLRTFCEDGERLGHEWSGGDLRYKQQETQEKLDRFKRTCTGPTLCTRFHGLNPEPCTSCKHWTHIRSPIVLGTAPPAPPDTAQEAFGPKRWRWEYTQGGFYKSKSYINAHNALLTLGLKFSHDTFNEQRFVEETETNITRELTDELSRTLRDRIIEKYGFDPGKDNTFEAATRLCEEHPFDPLLDHINNLPQWDGVPRIDTWLPAYAHAENTPRHRAYGRKFLIAMIRRARQPGCKFDYMLVQEAPQGAGKSSTAKILANGKLNSPDHDWHTDRSVIHLDDRALQEALRGIWICEVAELVGLNRVDIEHIKNNITKTVDSARAAYDRTNKRSPRRCCFMGTTNETEYLRDPTGGRRFWPVKINNTDLAALEADRNQLLAEAAMAEATGESLVIDPALFPVAAEAQTQRLMHDPWDDVLATINCGVEIHPAHDGNGREERVKSSILLDVNLGLPKYQQNDTAYKRARYSMQRQGWEGPIVMRFKDGSRGKGYRRRLPPTASWPQRCAPLLRPRCPNRRSPSRGGRLVTPRVTPGGARKREQFQICHRCHQCHLF